MLGFFSKKNFTQVNNIFNINSSTRTAITEPTNTAFACISLKAKYFSSLYDETLINGEVAETFLTPLLNSANQNHSWEQVKSLALSWAYRSGNAYIYTPEDNSGLPYAMYVLPSSKVKVYALSEVIDYYEYREGSQTLRIEPKNMIHFKRCFPSNLFAESFYLGQPKELEQCISLMELEMSATEFVQSFFDADGVSPYVLSADRSLQPEQLKKSKDAFNNSILNNKYHVQALIDSGMSVEPLAKSSQADGLAVKESSEITAKICRYMGVPLTMLDIDFAGQATAKQVIEFFYSSSLSSDIRNWEQTVTKWGRNYDPLFTYNVIDYVLDDQEEDRKQEVHDLDNGLRTINQILADRGLDPIGAEGNVRFLRQGLYPIQDMLMPAYEEPITGVKKKDLAKTSSVTTG